MENKIWLSRPIYTCMKTVILTSSGFLKPAVRQAILPFLPTYRPLKVGYVPTASQVVKDDSYAKKDVEIMERLGFQILEIDLVNDGPDEVAQKLSQQEVVYVQGGNGFYLLRYARQSGFINALVPLVNSGRLIYIGKSAGSYLACPTMEVHTWHSDKWNRFGVEDLTAMNLVPFLVQAHYTAQDDTAIKQGLLKSRYNLRLITNEQALVIQDDRVLLIGQGSENKIR